MGSITLVVSKSSVVAGRKIYINKELCRTKHDSTAVCLKESWTSVDTVFCLTHEIVGHSNMLDPLYFGHLFVLFYYVNC